MTNRNAYKDGQRRFDFHLAEDAITNWLSDKPATAAYLDDLENRLAAAADAGETEETAEALLDEAEAVAAAITDEVRRATGDIFTGTRYNALAAAARDRVDINW